MGSRAPLGIARFMLPVPQLVWRRGFASVARDTAKAVRFMGRDHHTVRDFVVAELPRKAEPLSAEYIAGQVGLSAERVTALLAELERRMVFLFRSDGLRVSWAYPVTVDDTPHRVELSTGERLNAA